MTIPFVQQFLCMKRKLLYNKDLFPIIKHNLSLFFRHIVGKENWSWIRNFLLANSQFWMSAMKDRKACQMGTMNLDRNIWLCTFSSHQLIDIPLAGCYIILLQFELFVRGFEFKVAYSITFPTSSLPIFWPDFVVTVFFYM